MESAPVVTEPDDALEGVVKLGIDTAPLIYFVEAHPACDIAITQVFRRIQSGEITGMTSVITLVEVLTQPLRKGKPELQEQYRSLLSGSAHFELVVIDAAIAEQAAMLRARYGLRTPDALQIATAISTNCQAFLTNDSHLRRVTELRVITMEDLQSLSPGS
jgi:predicted nucleic acid-binding protein